LLVLLILLSFPGPPLVAQGDSIEALLARMSVEEKVGQLFLVNFSGNDVSEASDIAQLIREYRVGGVLISPANGNFTNGQDTPLQVARLTNALQRLAFSPTQPLTNPLPIPLFIAVEHEGDGYPYTYIREGLTEVPNQMALGATWNEENAYLIGEIVGKELRALGVNLLLGPSLDVLDNPRLSLRAGLGTRTFGGDPYWVGKLGRAYIKGIHRGSGGHLAVVAKHFPGRGSSDRRADEEVATVQKSIQELRKIELAPFFAVTQFEGEPLAMADGLMSSHIRYRGFQGNIRQLTRPISLDAQSLQALLALPEFAPWREKGGLMMSEPLGVPAIRKYYDPQLASFPHKRIALEAFLAGNDLLYLSQFALTDSWPDQLENIKATIQFFQDKYADDPSFRVRVDESVKRILKLKKKLYPHFRLEETQVDTDKLPEVVGQATVEVSAIAKEAITLIYPEPEELADRLPSPPLSDEDILIFTDARQGRDCPTCESFPLISPHALEEIILRLYGPQASGQVEPERLHSFTFAQLKSFLAGEGPDLEPFIEDAEWIIFAMLDVDPDRYPHSDAVKQFLELRPDSLRDKKTIVIAYNAPYYLDTTEISKLTAYYSAYSKVTPFLEASVRALFHEFPPQAASPVSVEGVNYDLIVRLEPDPDQIIQLMLADMPPSGTPVPLGVKVGDTLQLRTGVILDRNGHPVPDGTPVVFRLFYPADSLELPRQEATTVNGVAETSVILERTGQLEISASSLSAQKSTTLVVTIQEDQPATIATVVPPPTPTPSPSPSPSPLPTVPSPVASPTPLPTPVSRPKKGGVGWADLLFSLMGALLLGGAGFLSRPHRPLHLRLRNFLWIWTWGLGGYILYGLKLWEIGLLQNVPPPWGALVTCLAFGLAAMGYWLLRGESRG